MILRHLNIIKLIKKFIYIIIIGYLLKYKTIYTNLLICLSIIMVKYFYRIVKESIKETVENQSLINRINKYFMRYIYYKLKIIAIYSFLIVVHILQYYKNQFSTFWIRECNRYKDYKYLYDIGQIIYLIYYSIKLFIENFTK